MFRRCIMMVRATFLEAKLVVMVMMFAQAQIL